MRITAEATPFDYTERFSFIPEQERRPRTLQDYRDQFGGSLMGEVTDPFGLTHEISLAPFSNHPATVYIKLQFKVVPEGEEFPIDYGDSILLKEYELPEGTQLPGV